MAEIVQIGMLFATEFPRGIEAGEKIPTFLKYPAPGSSLFRQEMRTMRPGATTMKNTTRTVSGIAFIVTALLCALPVQAVTLSAEDKDNLQAGRTIRKPLANSGRQGFYGGSSYTLIEAPVDVVWQAIQDYSAYHRIFDATTSVKEVEKRGDLSLVHYKMGYKLINLEYFVELKQDRSKYTLSFELVENRPHDILMARGYWRLFPQEGGRTLVAYVVSAKVPMGVVNLMNDDWHPMVEHQLVGAPSNIKRWLSTPAGRKYFTATARK